MSVLGFQPSGTFPDTWAIQRESEARQRTRHHTPEFTMQSLGKAHATSEPHKDNGRKKAREDSYNVRLDAYRVGAHRATEEEDVRFGPARGKSNADQGQPPVRANITRERTQEPIFAAWEIATYLCTA